MNYTSSVSIMHRIRPWIILACVLLTGPVVAAEPALPWKKDLDKAVETARKSEKRVFIDFSGDS